MIETFQPDTEKHSPDGWLSRKIALRRDRAFSKGQKARHTANSSVTSISGNLPTVHTNGSGEPKQANLGLFKASPGSFLYREGVKSTHEMTARELAQKRAAQNIISSSTEAMTRGKKKATRSHAKTARIAVKRHDKMARRYNRLNHIVGVLTGAVLTEEIVEDKRPLDARLQPRDPASPKPLAGRTDDNNPALQRLLSQRTQPPATTPLDAPPINRTPR